MIKAVLLDLGNVVLDVDFRRVFAFWAEAADVDVRRFYERWQLDDAYREHERGERDFERYAAALEARFKVDLPVSVWREGWNALFVGAYGGVVRRLPDVANRMPLYGFTNTNAVHHDKWSSLYEPELEPFHHIYVSSEIGLRKPDREAYEFVVQSMGMAPEEVLFLDDTHENIAGARQVGLNSVHVTSAGDVERELDGILHDIR
ncbi:MAG: HAD family phosphatase [Pseudomonadales bacterium]|jgi:putative hydrolase of the HAD superfamily|nr:HAD family phosphatase [Pseudomonadales bacterium]MDP6471116.1 HAD family phosphatase [Pseudomonadales bacterium]MDP6825698.1 HAD family phosphatase [Pseudomonadales bacterium]MDP6973154.1 HAD family phosphatase [Pseudomonadales bacterium]|tara:strand:- start:1085 stop:1696 length:612 start_codon:yes stop_codon:yes gene_type:complete